MSEEKLNAIKDAIVKNNHNTSDVDVLAKRLTGKRCGGGCGCGGGSDEITARIAQSIAINWRRYAFIIVVFIAALAVNDLYKKDKAKNSAEAAMAFFNIQTAFDSLNNKDFDKDKVFANLTLDFDVAGKSPAYKNLSALYTALFKLQNNKADEALKILEDNFNLKKATTKELTEPLKGKKTTVESLTSELAELVYIRALLSRPDADLHDIRSKLRQLIYRSNIVTVSAFSLYSSTAVSDNDYEAVIDLANLLKNKRPELTLSGL